MSSKSIATASGKSYGGVTIATRGNITSPIQPERYKAYRLNTPLGMGDSFSVTFRNLVFGANIEPPAATGYTCIWLLDASGTRMKTIGPYSFNDYYKTTSAVLFDTPGSGMPYSEYLPADILPSDEITIASTPLREMFDGNQQVVFIEFEMSINGTPLITTGGGFGLAYEYGGDPLSIPTFPFTVYVGWPPTMVLPESNYPYGVGSTRPIFTDVNYPGPNNGVVIVAASVTPA